jgi:hypothetical protein
VSGHSALFGVETTSVSPGVASPLHEQIPIEASPFAGVLDARTRWTIWRRAHADFPR